MRARQYSEAEREQAAAVRREQLERWQAEIVGKVTDLVNGAEWQRWLQVAAKFHQYSFNNQIMLMLQRPDATAVAGYQKWRTLGRQVNAGETGIKILAPITKQVDQQRPDGSAVLDADGNPAKGMQVVGYRLVSVFDVSQTSGRDLPEQPRPQLLKGAAPDGLWERLQGFVEAQGFRVERGDCGGANGVTSYDDKVVRVRADIDDAQAVKTLAHEAGHVLLHQPDARQGLGVCRGRGEVEAESVAYLVTAAHGVDSGQYTFSYVAGWAETAQAAAPKDTTLADIISSTGARVVKAADTILTTTKPPTAVQTDATPESVTREMRVDQALAQGHQSARTRPGARREPAPSRAGHPTVAPAR